MAAGSMSSSSSSDSSISSISSSKILTPGGGLLGTRSKSTEVRHSLAGGNRTPKTSGTEGNGTALVCDARDKIYYIQKWR